MTADGFTRIRARSGATPFAAPVTPSPHAARNVDDVVKNLASATNRSINFQPAFWVDPRNGNHYFMGVQYPEEKINSLDSLVNLPITGEGSLRPALLRNTATIRQTTGPAVINHRKITWTIRPTAGRYVAMHTRKDGKWLMASVREARGPNDRPQGDRSDTAPNH